mmetsp:Transcript_16174/g.53264  ORF Transcript_16174/g.53264 Transcript_16174/m.53264 type:complete len:234 (+) Transcript_16174:778-1479(+)
MTDTARSSWKPRGGCSPRSRRPPRRSAWKSTSTRCCNTRAGPSRRPAASRGCKSRALAGQCPTSRRRPSPSRRNSASSSPTTACPARSSPWRSGCRGRFGSAWIARRAAAPCARPRMRVLDGCQSAYPSRARAPPRRHPSRSSATLSTTWGGSSARGSRSSGERAALWLAWEPLPERRCYAAPTPPCPRRRRRRGRCGREGGGLLLLCWEAGCSSSTPLAPPPPPPPPPPWRG